MAMEQSSSSRGKKNEFLFSRAITCHSKIYISYLLVALKFLLLYRGKKPTTFIFCLYSRSKMGCLRCISRVKSFHVKILLLDKQELIQEVTEKTTGQDLLDNVFKYLNLIETAYFGLRYQDNDNQTVS